MRTVLVTDLNVECFSVFAEMAWLQRRPELGALCLAAGQHGGRITAALVQQILPGLSDRAAQNVMRACQDLGLCDKGGSLTLLGEAAAAGGVVQVPEQGVYAFWAAEHLLLGGSRLLHAERQSSSHLGTTDDLEPIPIDLDLGDPSTSVVDDAGFVLRTLPHRHEQPRCLLMDPRGNARLRWTLDFTQKINKFRLEGSLANRPIKFEPETEEDLDLWDVVAGWALGPLHPHGQWNTQQRRLAVRFDGLPTDDQEAFTRTLKLPQVEVPGCGTWKNVTLEEVPIGPGKAEDAQQWALARLDRRLRGDAPRRTRTEVRRLFAELTEGTPLEAHGPTLPAHDALLAGLANAPEAFWRLAAAVDLAPTPPAPEELAAMKVGTPAPAVTAPRGGFRIPYRGGWSMDMLADHVLGDAEPRRMLLCDRYVRGEENLDALQLLIETLKPAEVTVWTGDEVDDATLARIQAICGTKPRRYREVFKGAKPHDRYLAVDAGERFGWQMSNSPLDARWPGSADPTTPLRWRDLTATRLTPEQLPPAVATWLRGGAR